jgi:hypothetical protein
MDIIKEVSVEHICQSAYGYKIHFCHDRINFISKMNFSRGKMNFINKMNSSHDETNLCHHNERFKKNHKVQARC